MLEFEIILGEKFGHFELEALLGRGGMAEVFRARPTTGPHAGEVVAVKRLLPNVAHDVQAIDLFVSEADLGRYLHHPGIVQVLEAGSIDDTYYIAMEYIDGCDLGQLLTVCRQRKVRLPIDLACHVAFHVAQALHFAHSARTNEGRWLGIIHCDVTPANIFISRSGETKLADFGVAHNRVVGRALDEGLAGKPHYFAPEQILGQELTPLTDIFALGVILYQMLTNERPFDGKTVQEICDRVLKTRVPPPSEARPGVSARLDDIVARAIARRLPNDSEEESSVMEHIKSLVSKGPARYAGADLLAADLKSVYDPAVGSQKALAALLRGLTSTRTPGRAR